MKHYYITTEPPIICVCEPPNINDFCLMFDDFENLFLGSQPQQYLGIESGHHLNKGLRKIIAGLPNQPIIDHSALSDEDCKVIGCVNTQKIADKILSKYYSDYYENKWHYDRESKFIQESIITAQSLNDKKWSDEDMRKALDLGLLLISGNVHNEQHFQELLNKLKQPQVFEIEAIVQDNKVKFLKVL